MLATIRCCGECGHPLPKEMPVSLTPTQDFIFAAVKRAGKAGISAERLMTLLYSHRLNPPTDAAIPVHVYLLNKRLRPAGLQVRASINGSREYTLRVV